MIHADTNSREAIMKITEQGQITIPKELRERFGLSEDVEVEITPTKRGLLIQKRIEGLDAIDSVRGILVEHLGSDFDVDQYIEEIRGR